MDIKILKNLNVLYVEDDAIVAAQTLSLFEYYFHKVFYCGTAEEALNIYHNESVQLIITDVELPGMNGLTLCESIRKNDYKIPIFITSMYSEKELLKEAIKLNLVDYLIKPVSISTINDTIKESIDRMSKSGIFTVNISKDTRYYPLSGQLEKAKEIVSLSHSEMTLLNLLIDQKNMLVDRTLIEHHLFPDEPMSDASYKNLIYRLRKKIGKEHIVAISGMGIILKMGS